MKALYFSNFDVNVIGPQSSYIPVKTLVDVKNLISIQEFQAELRNKFVRVSGAKINERRNSTSRLEETQLFSQNARRLAETYRTCDVRLDSRVLSNHAALTKGNFTCIFTSTLEHLRLRRDGDGQTAQNQQNSSFLHG